MPSTTKTALKNYFLNLRPYSWGDVLLLCLLGKVFTSGVLDFQRQDLLVVSGVLSLWFFYNLILEFKHAYAYRGKMSITPSVLFLMAAMIIGWSRGFLPVLFAAVSTLLVVLYLQKGRFKPLGYSNNVIRGLIQSCYFLYVVTFFTDRISRDAVVISTLIFLAYTARGIMGDVRDVLHNKASGKITLPVRIGILNSRLLAAGLLAASVVLQAYFFKSFWLGIPLALYALATLFCSNGYVLHQLIIITTSFIYINLIAFLTTEPLLFFNLIYAGIFLNHIFYPLLKRKSNPIFVQQQ